MGEGKSVVIDEAWEALGGDPALLEQLVVEGDPGLPSRFAVGDLALGSVGAQVLAAAELAAGAAEARPANAVSIVVDARHVGVAFRSERYLRVDGVDRGPGFAPLSRFVEAADGWVRLHANYPQHRAAVDAALGAEPLRAAAGLSVQEVEDRVVGAGGAAAKVRTADEWSAHPQGAAVRSLPLLHLGRVGETQGRGRAGGSTRAAARGATVSDSAGDSPLLGGLRVLDLTRVIAGPVGTRTLASYGADVFRVDSPHNPEDPASLQETGPGKRHVQLDLARPVDRRVFDDLLADADVLVQGYRPGALAALGLHPDELAARQPGLVVVSLSAWGSVGPWAGRRGFDSIVQAATGIADETRAADGTPGVLPAQALDHGAGHLLAAIVLRAVTLARTEGGTWHGELSLARLAAWLMAAPRLVEATSPTSPDSKAHAAATDPERFLTDLPSAAGTLTVVRPPGSPVWSRGVQESTPAQAHWQSTSSRSSSSHAAPAAGRRSRR